MAKWTQAQRREKELNNFNDKYIHDIDTARKIINSYYRLCGLSYRVCELQNDEYWHNKPYTQDQEAKEARHIDRIKAYLKPYGLTLDYSGIYPSICIKDPKTGGIATTAYFHIS